ncbi:MAG: 3-deoxy-7-phosphoheptulonate synthase [Verrucomicrobiales bacterium]|nr:3-deoxy-7-phosphoheptulonate synthase [Verrucomicrobiales bacterium]
MPFHIPTDDVRIEEIRALIAPDVLMQRYRPDDASIAFITRSRAEIEAILRGQDPRLLCVVGPCSIHDEAAAREYGELLRQEAQRHAESLLVVMRVYFEKPRTTVGWKGFINDPGLDESYDINRGLELARALLLDLAKSGIAVGTEFLDTISPQYIADLVSWGAIGARTTESQVHRQLASGLSMPVGFKNGTTGTLDIAIDAICAARHPHHFLSVTKEGRCAIVKTRGNDTCHIILRGGKDGPNYSPEHISKVTAMLEKAGLPATIMVDCSHGNSSKNHRNQPAVAEALASQIRAGNRAITGIMLESNFVEGRQDAAPGTGLVFGQSITDACLGWDDTAATLKMLADAARHR